jgi:hypothetical protein
MRWSVLVVLPFLAVSGVNGQSTYLSMSPNSGPACDALDQVAQYLRDVGDTAAAAVIDTLSTKGAALHLTPDRWIFDAGDGAAYYFNGNKITYQTGTGFVDVLGRDSTGQITLLYMGQLGKTYKEDIIHIAFARASWSQDSTSRAAVPGWRRHATYFLYAAGDSVLLGHKTHKGKKLWKAQIQDRETIGYFDSHDNFIAVHDDGTETPTGNTLNDAAYFPVRDLWFAAGERFGTRNGELFNARITTQYPGAPDAHAIASELRVDGPTRFFSDCHILAGGGYIDPTATKSKARQFFEGLRRTLARQSSNATEARLISSDPCNIYQGKLFFALPVFGGGAPRLVL